MGLQLVTPPTELPVSLSMAKRHCRVDHNDDDSVIDIYIGSATKTLDGKDGTLGRCLMPQTWDLYWDAFPCGALQIPLPPLISVSAVNYVDADGTWQPMPPADYVVDTASTFGWVVPVNGWPSAMASVNSVQVRFQAGYVNGVPDDIRHAILLMVGNAVDVKASIVVGATVAETDQAHRLLSPYRIIF
jgi:uncharacterized phiE125 gp8 family phage protein